MDYCEVGDLRWQARLRLGAVQYNVLNPPVPQQAKRALTGLDGGDFSSGLAGGHRPLAVDGGDWSDPQWQWSGSPLVADGGRWS